VSSHALDLLVDCRRNLVLARKQTRVDARRHLHPQGLMHPLLVVALDKRVEARRSVRRIRSCRPFCSGGPA
jgi:hypothetical protein